MKKRSTRLISLLLAICMIAGMLEAPLGLLTVNAADDPTTPSIPGATKYYINNDFETDTSDVSLLPRADGNVAEVRKGNTYIYMEKNTEADPQISRDLSDVVDASCVAVEVELATTKLSGATLQLTGTAPEAAEGEDPAQPQALDFISINAEGKISSLGKDTGKTIAADGAFVTVTLAINSDANTYSLWIGGKQILHGKNIGANAFGKVSAMAIKLNGDVINAANLMVDNLKVYSYTAVPTSYYENDFSENAEGIELVTGEKHTSAWNSAGYLYLSNTAGDIPVAYWNKGEDGKAIQPLADQFVVSFDHTAYTKWVNFRFYLVDENGDDIQILWNKGDGALKRYYLNDAGTATSNQYSLPVSTDEVTNYRSVTLAFDMVSKTYSYWGDNYNANGVVEALDLKLPDSDGTFGTPQYIALYARDGSSNGGNVWIDNLKIYEGTAARDASVVGADPSVIPEAVDTYIDDSFDGTVLTSELEFYANDVGNKVEVAAANHYVYLEKQNITASTHDVQIYKNFDGAIDSDYVVVSADIASTSYQAARFYFNGTLGPNVRANGVVFWGSGGAGKTLAADGSFVNVTVVFDSVAETYAFWLGGELVKSGTWSGGKLDTLKISLNGGVLGENLMVDNLKVYSYAVDPDETEPATSAPATSEPTSEPATTAPADTVKVYYNNDFNENADGITFAALTGTAVNNSGHKFVEGSTDEGYLYLNSTNNNGAVAYWNKGDNALTLPKQFVVSFDHTALTTWADWRLNLVDENGNKINVLWNKANNSLKRYFLKDDNTAGTTEHWIPASTAEEMKFHSVTIAFDMEAMTYSYWADNGGKTSIVEDLNVKLADTTGTFGTVQYIELTARGDSGGNVWLDNLKIYEGTAAIENVGPQNQFPQQPDPEDTEPATSEPATSEPATSEPATSEPATSEPAASEPAATVNVYYNNDFNENADGITFAELTGTAVNNSGHKFVEGSTDQGYLYLNSTNNNGAVAYWNKGDNALTLPKQFVVSFDHTAYGGWANWRLYLVDEDGDKIEVLWNNSNGGLKRVYLDEQGTVARKEHSIPKYEASEIKYRTVTLAFDMETKTYSYWADNYDANGVIEALNLKLADTTGTFGTVQYIEFTARGDTGGNVSFDFLQIYEGTEVLANVGPQNQFPPEPDPEDPTDPTEPTEPTGPVDVYYNNDFNENADGITFATLTGTAVNHSEHKLASGEGYLYLRAHNSNNAVAFWNKGSDGKALLELPEKFVVSFDHTALTTWANFRIYLVDEDGDKLQILWNMGNGSLKRYYLKDDGTNGTKEHSLPASTDEETKYRSVTLAFDMETKTYSYWADNYGATDVVEDLGLKLADPDGTFGTPQYIEFYARGDDSNGGNIWLDNLKIYSGNVPVADVGAQNQFPAQPDPEDPTEPAGPTEPTGPVDVYYNNDFNENADGITFASMSGNSTNYSEHKLVSGEGYLYLRCHNSNSPVAYWNKGADGKAILELPEQFVVSFDHTAYTKWANFRVYLVDEDGDKLQILWNMGNGSLKRYYLKDDGTNGTKEHSLPTSTDEETKYRSVTLAFDMETKTYSYWADDYNAANVIEDLGLKLADPDGTFGTPQYIEFYARGDDGNNGNIWLDNLKVYSGTAPLTDVGPQDQFPPEPEPTEPIKVWYNNDFNENAKDITFVGSSEGKHVLENGEGYLYLRRVGDTKVAFWNRGTDGKARAPLANQFVISLDVSTTAMPDGGISIVDENGKEVQIIIFSAKDNYLKAYRTYEKDGEWTTGISNIGYNYTDGRTHKLDIVIDTEAGTFSVWKDDSLVLNNLYLNDNDFSFGTPQYVVFSSNDKSVGVSDDGNAQYINIDNLRIYGGNVPLADPGAVTETPTLPEDSGLTPPVVVDPADVGNDVYYNNDFSENAEDIHLSNDASSIPLNDRKNIAKHQNQLVYLWRTESGQPSAYWNRADSTKGKLKMSDYFVVSFDLSTTSLGPSYIQIVGEDEKMTSLAYIENGRIRFYRINDAGKSSYAVSEGVIANDGTPVHIDIAINTNDCVYSAWVNGEKLFSNERFTTSETFGKMQYIRWYVHNSLKDENENVIPTNLMLDNLQVYDGIEPKSPASVGEVTVKYVFPRPEGIDPGNGRYYESDLEDKSTEELTLIGGSELIQEANGNHSIKMNVGAWFSWNYLQKWEPSEYVVYEASVCTSNMGTLLFKVGSDTGNSFYPVKIRKTFEITPSHAATEQKLKNGEWVNIAVAINAVDNTYSVWYDGILVAENLQISKTEFGKLQGFRFDVTDGELATTEWRVDNLKVYQGFSPDDYANTVQLTEQPKDESWLVETMGTQSSLLDYSTEELAIIDAAGAVLVNTDTLYIYQNGKRTQGTQAQVDALLANTSGKTVIKNDLGLVIISPKALELTEDQIESLHSYMVYTRPTADTLKSLFNSVSKNAHPRIILNEDKLDQLRSDYKNNDMIKEWADAIIKRCDLRLKSKHIEFSDASFTRSMRDNYPQLALAYLLTGETKYKDYLWEDIKGVCEFPNWKSTDGLAKGDASYGMAIAYDWLYDAWTPEQRNVMEEAIYNNILYYQHKAIYGKISGTGTYYASETNRNAVSNGGPGMAIIAVFDVYPDKCADLLEKTYHLLEIMLAEFAPDGANTEGPAYWEYLMRYLAPFMQSTLYTFGDDFNIFDAPGFDRTVDFYLDIDGMTGVNNLHDAVADNHGVAGEVFCLANMLNRPDLTRALLAKMDVYGLDDGLWSLMYYDTSIKYDGTVDRALDAYYKGLEFVSMRSSWLNSAGIYASLHSGGHAKNSHNHVDVGSFVLDIGGQRFASDYGKESYDLKASGEYRYYYYRIRPEGHNVFVINPDTTGKDIGMNLVTETVSEFVSKSRGAYTIISMDKAYEGYAQSASRGMMLGDDRKSVLIRDEIRGMTKDQNEVWWFMQMENVEVTISDDGKSAILSKGGVDVHMQVASNASSWEIKLLPAEEMYPLEGLPDQENQTPNTNYTRLAIVFKTGKDVNINVKFAEVDDPKGDTPINDVALANWSIPDGVLVADPTLYGIEIGGVEIPNFNKNQTFYNFELPYGTTECPDVKVIGGEGCDITIKKPKSLPGYLNITVASKADSKSQTKYKIYLTVSGPIKVEVSDTPEAENHAKNMLDGNLKTRWAVNGAGWAKFTFPEPQMVDAIWLASWEQTMRVQPFSISVSEDGVNFTKVWEGTTELLPEGSKDQLQEFKIPEGKYLSIRLDFTGARYTDGREYSWTSVLEVMFYYQGKPIEIILQTSEEGEDGFTGNPNDTVQGGNSGDSTGDGTNDGNDPTGPADPDATQPGSDDEHSGGSKSGTIWLIVGLSVAAVLVAGAIIFIILLKKKKAKQDAAEDGAQEQQEAVQNTDAQ